jgi:hypothetical protein
MRNKNIGFDASYWYSNQNRGIGNMTEQIVKNISQQKHLNISLYSNHYDQEISQYCDQHNLAYHVIPIPFLIYEQIVLPILSRWHKIDLFHYFGNTGSVLLLPARISIITICDTIFWERSVLGWVREKKFGNAYRSVIARIQKRLNYNFSFISHYTKSCYLDSDKDTHINQVIYISGGQDFSISQDKPFSEKYICAMGAKDPRKNTLLTIKAFIECKIFKNFGIELRIFGLEDPEKFIKDSDLENVYLVDNGVTISGFVNDAQKEHILKYSRGFIYLSKSEGFGIPIVEAEKLGKMCLVSSTTSCGEIVSPYSYVVDPTNDKAVRETLLKYSQLIFQNGVDNITRKKIIDHANNFSWARSAHETVAFYTQLFNRTGS